MRAALSLIFAAVALLAPLGDAHAQYKWRDAQGHITMSDRPPPSSVPARDVLERPAPQDVNARAQAVGAAQNESSKPNAAVAKAETRSKESAPSAVPSKAEVEAGNQRKEMEEKNASAARDNCARARRSIATFDSGMRVATVNAAGEREVMEDKQRAAEVARLQEIANSNCK